MIINKNLKDKIIRETTEAEYNELVEKYKHKAIHQDEIIDNLYSEFCTLMLLNNIYSDIIFDSDRAEKYFKKAKEKEKYWNNYRMKIYKKAFYSNIFLSNYLYKRP